MSFENEDMELVTLEFEDADPIDCIVLGVFECEGKEYVALVPQDTTDEVFLYGYREAEDDSFEVLDIEDDDEFERVQAAFEEIAEDWMGDLEPEE